MAHFLPPEHVRQVNKLEWPKRFHRNHQAALDAVSFKGLNRIEHLAKYPVHVLHVIR